tara:strand:+ start:1052 stop:1915 length:864 start_codon:yes stop_codon:yes gene_type:complete
MNKIIFLCLTSLVVLLGCNSDETSATVQEKPQVVLFDFIHEDIKLSGEENKYYEALRVMLYPSELDIFPYYMATKEDISVYESKVKGKNVQTLTKVWNAYYREYALDNYFHHYTLQKGNVNVIYAPETIAMLDPVETLKQRVKKLMVIHNAIYSKTAGNTKMLNYETLDFSDDTVEKVYQDLKYTVITKQQLSDAFDSQFEQYLKAANAGAYKSQGILNNSLIEYFTDYYSTEGTEYIFSRILYDLADIKLEVLGEDDPKFAKLHKQFKYYTKLLEQKPVYNFTYNY